MLIEKMAYVKDFEKIYIKYKKKNVIDSLLNEKKE